MLRASRLAVVATVTLTGLAIAGVANAAPVLTYHQIDSRLHGCFEAGPFGLHFIPSYRQRYDPIRASGVRSYRAYGSCFQTRDGDHRFWNRRPGGILDSARYGSRHLS